MDLYKILFTAILCCFLCSRTTADVQGEVEVLDDFPFDDDGGGGSNRDDEGGGKETTGTGDLNELEDIDLSAVEQAEGSRQELLRKVMTAAMAKPGARQRLAQVMPILRTMSATQRLALAGLVTSQLMAAPGSPRPNITSNTSHTDDLMIPISMDIAAMFRGLGRDAAAARSNLFRPDLYKRHPPRRRKPVQNLNRRNTDLPIEEMRPPPPPSAPPRVKMPKRPGMGRFPPPLPPTPVQLRPSHEAGDNCEYFTNNICLQVAEYPMEAILKSIQSTPNKNAFEALRMDSKQDFGEIAPKDGPAMERRQSQGDNGLSVDAEEQGHVCSSKVEIARPKRARATNGQWKYVVNTAEYTQTLRLEMCLRPQQSCSYLADNVKSECTQVYNYHRLLTWDHQSGLTMDIFKVPTCCSCHIHSKPFLYPNGQGPGVEPQPVVPSQPLEPVRHATSPPRISYGEAPENNFVAADEPVAVHRLPPPKQILNRRPVGGLHNIPKRESLPTNRVKGSNLGQAERPDDPRYPYPPYENLLRRTISRNSTEFNEIRPKYHPVQPTLNQRHPELPIDSLLADNSFAFVTSEPDYLADTRYKPTPTPQRTHPPTPQRTYPSTPHRVTVTYQSTPPTQPPVTSRRPLPSLATTSLPPSKRINYSYHPIIDFFKTSVSNNVSDDKLNNAEWTPITDGPRFMPK